MGINIAIDGPAGAGKSTIAKNLAGELGYVYVDTGAMFRTIALFCLRKGIDLKNESAVSDAAAEADVVLAYEDGEQQIFLNGENVSSEIRREEVGNAASAVSVYPAVRFRLLTLQRELAQKADVIMDGRDIGTVVLPKAQVKIFLTASPRVRAKRRYDELTARGQICDLDAIEADIRERDHRDMTRDEAPLRQAGDAILLDTSGLDIQGVVKRMEEIIKEKLS